MRYGKGSKGTGYKRRWVPMLDGLEKLFLWYLQNVRPLFTEEESGALFLSEKGQRLSRDTGRQVLKRRQIQLGFQNDEIFSLHQLRNAFATLQTERGVDLLTLKTLLGHSNISTTFTY
ncbi:site-specific integrase [Clostridium sp.]|uniref:tyrosine-type recombinase/integrase n=1 Tax=Clostridium sp. TaxID=1506 RepID=UPI0025C1AB80|nr:site-specific integrase [Clostridium sp.]